MNHMLKKLFSVTALLCVGLANASSNSSNSSNSVVTSINPRSIGRYKLLDDSNMSPDFQWRCNEESWNGFFSITPGYMQSMKPSKMVNSLFGPFLTPNTSTGTTVSTSCSSGSCSSGNSCNNNCISIQGSAITNRTANSLVADNFYLPQDFNSIVCFKPKFQNAFVNFDFYLGFDEWMCGTYLRVYGPYVHSKAKLDLCESLVTTSTQGASYGQLTPGYLTNAQLLPNFTSYANGNAPAATTGTIVPPPSTIQGPTVGSTPPTVTFQGLQFAQMGNADSQNGFADLRVEFGYNFLCCDDYHLGINIQGSAPTGKKQTCCFLFSPRIGTDKWELGGGATGHWTFWRGESEDCQVGFYFDVNITHLFKREECRVFDLNGKPLSRYLLAQQMTSSASVINGLVGGATFATSTPATSVFANVFAPVANLTAQDVKVGYGVQADALAWFNVVWCGFNVDVGYNYWARSKDQVDTSGCNSSNSALNGKTWALNGQAEVFGFVETSAFVGSSFPLSATNSNATISSGIPTGSSRANAGVDNQQLAWTSTGAAINEGGFQQYTSIQPVFLSTSNVNYDAGSRGMSHTVFGSALYTFDCECWVPFVGVGGFAEFGQNSSSSCNTSTTSTTSTTSACGSSDLKSSVSNWGVWVKLGLSFN